MEISRSDFVARCANLPPEAMADSLGLHDAVTACGFCGYRPLPNGPSESCPYYWIQCGGGCWGNEYEPQAPRIIPQYHGITAHDVVDAWNSGRGGTHKRGSSTAPKNPTVLTPAMHAKEWGPVW